MNQLIEALKPFPYWVCRGSDKRPCVARWYQPGEKPVGASPSDPKKSGRSYGVAAKVAAKVEAFKGIGFILEKSLGIVCIDLDHCIDDQGNVTPFAAGILKIIGNSGGTYVEYSPSHTGLHIWGYGELPSGKESGIRAKRQAEGVDIELYQDKRYMTVTGEPYGGCDVPLGHVQEAIDGIIKKYGLETKVNNVRRQEGSTMKRGAAPDDDQLIEKIRISSQAALFSSLFDRGEIAPYGDDHSRADFALLGILRWWTNGNEAQMARIFLRSKLAEDIARKKRHEEDYLMRSIQKVMKEWDGEGYRPIVIKIPRL